MGPATRDLVFAGPIGLQRPFARFLVRDHLDRIIAALVVGRIVDAIIVHIGEFGHVFADIVTRVELLALRKRNDT